MPHVVGDEFLQSHPPLVGEVFLSDVPDGRHQALDILNQDVIPRYQHLLLRGLWRRRLLCGLRCLRLLLLAYGRLRAASVVEVIRRPGIRHRLCGWACLRVVRIPTPLHATGFRRLRLHGVVKYDRVRPPAWGVLGGVRRLLLGLLLGLLARHGRLPLLLLLLLMLDLELFI